MTKINENKPLGRHKKVPPLQNNSYEMTVETKSNDTISSILN